MTYFGLHMQPSISDEQLNPIIPIMMNLMSKIKHEFIYHETDNPRLCTIVINFPTFDSYLSAIIYSLLC